METKQVKQSQQRHVLTQAIEAKVHRLDMDALVRLAADLKVPVPAATARTQRSKSTPAARVSPDRHDSLIRLRTAHGTSVGCFYYPKQYFAISTPFLCCFADVLRVGLNAQVWRYFSSPFRHSESTGSV